MGSGAGSKRCWAKILPLPPRALGRVCPRNTDAAISEKMAAEKISQRDFEGGQK